jgi:hypothetical protein
VERVKEYSEVEGEAPAIIAGHRPPSDWPKHGHIAIRGLCMAYRPGLPLVLKVQRGPEGGGRGGVCVGVAVLTLVLCQGQLS